MTERAARRFKGTAKVLDRLLTELYASLKEDESQPQAEPHLAENPLRAESPPDTDEQLAQRALEAAHALLGQLERSRPHDEKAVAQLLAAPTPERWRRAVADSSLQRPEVIELLLTSVGSAGASQLSAQAEETCLLALHLCERLDPAAYPAGLVGDLLCRALALRAEQLIARRRLRAAELACLRTRDLLLESSDPLVAQEVGLASALLHWAEGDQEEALALLNGLGRLAAVLVRWAGWGTSRFGAACCLLSWATQRPPPASRLRRRISWAPPQSRTDGPRYGPGTGHYT